MPEVHRQLNVIGLPGEQAGQHFEDRARQMICCLGSGSARAGI